MSRRTSNLPPAGNWPLRIESDTGGEHHNDWNQRHPMIPQILFDDRVRTGPQGFTGQHVPRQPRSPGRALLVNEMVPVVNHRPRQFDQQFPPGLMNQRPMESPPLEDKTRLTQKEKKALEKLKKQVYLPPLRWKSKTWCLYYRDVSNISKGREEEKDERCPICWEDFVANEELLVTPCNHMFHGDCIVPWVKSNGQCPVCRSFIS